MSRTSLDRFGWNRGVRRAFPLLAVSALALIALPSVASAQLQKIEPGFTPGARIPFQLQHSPGGQNWQGALMKIHLFDATEIEGGTVTMTVSGFGAGTAIVGLTSLATSNSIFISLTNGEQSGIVPDQVVVNVVASLEPGGTQVGESSDLDFSVMLFDIRHRTFTESVVFLPSAVITLAGQWLHITDQTTLTRQPSDLRAFNVGNIQVGVDHVPEPATLGLLGSGLLCSLLGCAARRRRLG